MATHSFSGDDTAHVCDLVGDDLDEHLWFLGPVREHPVHRPIIDALTDASRGVRTDCHWAPDTGALLAVPAVAVVMAQILAARASNALVDGNPAWRGLLRLHTLYSSIVNALFEARAGYYERHLLVTHPLATQLSPDPVEVALGAAPSLPASCLKAALAVFDAAHALSQEHIAFQVTVAPDEDQHVGLHVAHELVAAVRSSAHRAGDDTADVPSQLHSHHAVHGVQLHVARSVLRNIGAELDAWSSRTRDSAAAELARQFAEYLVEGTVLPGETGHHDVAPLAVIARAVTEIGEQFHVEVDGYPEAQGDPSVTLPIAHLTEHFQSAPDIIRQLPRQWSAQRHILAPPFPDLHLHHLKIHLDDLNQAAGDIVVHTFARAMRLAADAMIGGALFEERAPDLELAVQGAAAVSSRRARALTTGLTSSLEVLLAMQWGDHD